MNIRSHKNIKDVWHVTTGVDGPRVVVFGGTHGNEPAGVDAIFRLYKEFQSGVLTLERGEMYLVRVNNEALAVGKRQIEYDMNRMFMINDTRTYRREAYEYIRTQELKPLLEKCDYFIDIHSTAYTQEPFLIAENHARAVFQKLGIRYLITGWAQLSAANTQGDAENYANYFGAKSATFESGSHESPHAAQVAHRVVLALLHSLEMLKKEILFSDVVSEVFELYQAQTKLNEDFTYLVKPNTFLFLPKGTAYAMQGGESHTVHEDSYLIMPAVPEERKVGADVCYLARKK